jgi:hypothetical protein
LSDRAASGQPGAPSVAARFAVDVNWDAPELQRRLEHALLFLPSGSVVTAPPFGFSFRREPDAFAAIATGMAFGMGIMLAEFSWRIPYFSYVGVVLSATFFATSAYLLGRFLRNALQSVEVVAERDEVVLRVCLARRPWRTVRVHADRIVNVVVLHGNGPPRVVLGGPRHQLLDEIYATRSLDPDTLAVWMAEAVSLVARHASLAPPAHSPPPAPSPPLAPSAPTER